MYYRSGEHRQIGTLEQIHCNISVYALISPIDNHNQRYAYLSRDETILVPEIVMFVFQSNQFRNELLEGTSHIFSRNLPERDAEIQGEFIACAVSLYIRQCS